MVRLSTLGSIELRRDGTDARSVLSQPKRLALLAYLRIAAPGTFVPRDRLLALFWPESDSTRARNALRQSLHFLRRSLGDQVVVNRSEQEVGVEEGEVECDVAAFRSAASAGRLEEAAALYRGEFLPGFHVDEAPELERWIDETRSELARLASRVVWSLSEREEERGEPGAAILWARRGVALDPLGEVGVRRLMQLLTASGERAAALDVFRDLERRLREDLDIGPGGDTVALADGIRKASPPPPGGPADLVVPAAAPPPPPIPAPPPTPASPSGLDPAPAVPGGYVGRGLTAVALLAGLILVLIQGGRGEGPPPSETLPAVAVLPFLDLSPGGTNVFFSDGVSEELLNVLAGVPGLRVAARTSSFAFRNQDVSIDSIARTLNVTHVLEGSVRTDGDRLRITAQLIEATSGYPMWSGTYDRTVGDVFAVQDEISAAIARSLQIQLSGNFWGASARETDDPEAYRLLLRALHAFRSPSAENYASSVTLLTQALHRDPEYARAHGALANVLLWQAYQGWADPSEAFPRADSLAHRSLELGETPEAHLALARLAETRGWDPDAADAHFLRALALNPSDTRTLQYRALFLARSGRGDEAMAAAARASELDPLHPGAWVNRASVLSSLGREEEALRMMERARVVAPDDVLVLMNLANQYSNLGRNEEALATSEQALTVDATNPFLLGLRVHILFRMGRTEEALAGLAELEATPTFPRYRLAALYANTDRHEHTLDLLEESARRREDELTDLRSPGMFPALRGHPRFQKLLAAVESGSG